MINKLLENIPVVSCQESTRLMSKAMDTRLTFKEWVDMRLHGLVCAACTRFGKQIHGMRQLLQTKITLPQSAKDRIKSLLK